MKNWSDDEDAWMDDPLKLLRREKQETPIHAQQYNVTSTYKRSARKSLSSSHVYKNEYTNSKRNDQVIKSLVKRNEDLAKELGKLKELNRQHRNKIIELNTQLLKRETKNIPVLVSTSSSPLFTSPFHNKTLEMTRFELCKESILETRRAFLF